MPVRAADAVSVRCNSNFISLSILSLLFLYVELDGVFHHLVGQCKVPNVLHILHVMELNTREIFLWNFFYIFLIGATHHDIGDACALCRQYLFFYSAHGQHLSA